MCYEYPIMMSVIMKLYEYLLIYFDMMMKLNMMMQYDVSMMLLNYLWE